MMKTTLIPHCNTDVRGANKGTMPLFPNVPMYCVAGYLKIMRKN